MQEKSGSYAYYRNIFSWKVLSLITKYTNIGALGWNNYMKKGSPEIPEAEGLGVRSRNNKKNNVKAFFESPRMLHKLLLFFLVSLTLSTSVCHFHSFVFSTVKTVSHVPLWRVPPLSHSVVGPTLPVLGALISIPSTLICLMYEWGPAQTLFWFKGPILIGLFLLLRAQCERGPDMSPWGLIQRGVLLAKWVSCMIMKACRVALSGD